MAKKDKPNNNPEDEEIITSSGSGIAQADESARGRRGARGKRSQATEDEELITSSGSGIAQADESARGRRGARGKRSQATEDEELITSSGSGIAQADESARGRRGARGKRSQATEDEELITSSGSGIAEIERPRGRAALNQKSNNIVRKDGDLPDSFTLHGKTYKTVKLISASTAEARVILVEKDKKKYALKLYYANIGHGPDPEVLRKVKESDCEGLIKIYDFGVWVNPENTNEECDYELMQYCEGGALKPGSFHGDREGLIDAVWQMIMATTECATIGIIHRDIKPENFLWVDKEHTKLVLSDFGFAVPCPDGESVRVEDHRTKIYTAPEFYLRAPGYPAKVDHASDVYSVGLSMLTLWSGEEVMMGHTETDLIAMKSQEKLPYPEDMDSDVLMLLKGLTRGRPDERWDDQTVLRWGKGELDEDDKQFDNQGEINITFDSAKGLVAHSRGELAELMINNQTLAKKYLYSGRIVKWLEDADLNDVAVEVERIVEKVYPKNQEAGLWSVIYLLSPSAPYFFPGFDFSKIDEDENQASSLHDVGVVIWNNVVVNADQKFLDRLAKEFASKDTNLALYLEKEGKKDLFKKVQSLMGGTGKSSSIVVEALRNDSKISAIWYLMYNLKPDLPWVVKKATAETVDELLDEIKEQGVPPYNMKYEAFVEWLLPRDPVLAAKVKNVLSEKRGKDLKYYYGETNEYDVAYALSPYMDYHFSRNPKDEDRVFTPEELAESLNEQIFIDFDDFAGGADSLEIIGMDPMSDESAIHYLYSKGKYDDLLKWIESCYVNEEHNEKKYGPYDERYAAFKILKGLSGGKAPFYEFPDGTRIRSLEEMRKIDRDVLKDALENGVLAPWIATFYQENPYADLKPQYAFEKLTVKFLEEIGNINPEDADYVDYKEAEKKIDKAVNKASNGFVGMKFTRYFMLPLLAVLFLIVAVLTVVKGIPEFNPVDGRYVGTAIVLSVLGVIIMLLGEVGFVASVFGGALIGFLGALLLYWGLDFIAPWLTWIYLAIILLAAWGMFVSLKDKLSPPALPDDAPDMKDPGFQFRELEALHYAYKYDSSDEDSANSDDKFTMEYYADRFSRGGKRQLGQSISDGALYLGIVIALFVGLYFLSPALSGERSIAYESLNPGPKIMGLYSGTVDETGKGALRIDSVTGMHVDSAKMTIDGKSIFLQGDVKRKGSEKFALTLTPMENADSANMLYGEYTLDLNLKKNFCNGRFIPVNPDKNGDIVPRTIAFTTADEEAASAASKPAETKKGGTTKKNTKKKATESAASPAASSSAAKATATETTSEAAEKVESSGFKLEPVEKIPDGGSSQQNAEEPKNDAKKERKPLKTPTGR